MATINGFNVDWGRATVSSVRIHGERGPQSGLTGNILEFVVAQVNKYKQICWGDKLTYKNNQYSSKTNGAGLTEIKIRKPLLSS